MLHYVVDQSQQHNVYKLLNIYIKLVFNCLSLKAKKESCVILASWETCSPERLRRGTLEDASDITVRCSQKDLAGLQGRLESPFRMSYPNSEILAGESIEVHAWLQAEWEWEMNAVCKRRENWGGAVRSCLYTQMRLLETGWLEIGHDQFTQTGMELYVKLHVLPWGPVDLFKAVKQSLTCCFLLPFCRIPRWLLWTRRKLRLFPSWPSILTDSVSSRVSLHSGLWARSHWGIRPTPNRRPKVHGHDLPRWNPQSWTGLTELSPASPRRRLQGWT